MKYGGQISDVGCQKKMTEDREQRTAKAKLGEVGSRIFLLLPPVLLCETSPKIADFRWSHTAFVFATARS